MMLFLDRHDAGRQLAKHLTEYKGLPDVLVLGLARGGVVVAYEVASALSAPLNVVVPRKIGAPGNPELALGSIMENGEGFFNESIIHLLGVDKNYIEREIEKEKEVAKKRLSAYRRYAPLPAIKDHTIILVDDGIATGSTMLASIEAMRKAGAKKVVVAVPVSAGDSFRTIEQKADEAICPHVREDLLGVGMFYRLFTQTDDSEVIEYLKKANSQYNQS